MLFNSGEFIIFFPIVVVLFFIIPKKLQTPFLLFASYYFYMCWNAKYAILIATSTVITYLCGLVIPRVKKRGWKIVMLCLCICSNLGILFYFKYLNFALSLLGRFFSLFHIALHVPAFDILLPVGISFYTFQALAYTLDVYRGDIEPEHSFLRYALFVSFFPQLVAGPIERSRNLLCQINETHRFDWDRAKSGVLLMVFGYFQKLIIAGRACVIVDNVFANFETYSGVSLLFACFLFAMQIYCDFGGYSMIAIGAAKVMGFSLMPNFRQPYFAVSIQDFWHRWHISLSTWFRDYLYIPLGGNRHGSIRKYFNLMLTFLSSGLWHGASLHFVVWGALNGFYQVLESCFSKWHRKASSPATKPSRVVLAAKRLFTFFLTCMTWVFFRAESVTKALRILARSFQEFHISQLWNGTLYSLGLPRIDVWILCLALVLLWLMDFLHERGGSFQTYFYKSPLAIRFGFYLLVSMSFLLQAISTFGEPAASFLYFQF